ncbi:type III pantothenate kinase [Ignavibacteria bacterium CHB1]|nr:MAG: type III pantothenate kinase [Chlorobiota bacterium]MBV6398762.1 Type III pantothenate kinase [Ignavibacteria bacterium]MCC6885066.1 type III pantothenate kinase [Ignavibacteriales bacterium]MCE7952143.1 type III pantothenate kinase [Chlorobi bacterium CHB7]MDL1886300.1 type III pantothenate kinase [Ignavibacteria bacterium CHB1]RIK49455.1 MAG: hypothetical protein DCC60_03920 [Ignavibacteriota bacterium]
MKSLVIDIGNSTIKSSHINSDLKIDNFVRRNYTKKSLPKLLRKIAGQAAVTEKVIVSVSNKIHYNSLVSEFSNLNFINDKMRLPFEMNYKTDLGRDRICAVAGATYYGADNILIVDFGTATTFNILSKKHFKGGIIAPGLTNSLKCFTKTTGLQTAPIDSNLPAIADNTPQAVASGVYRLNKFGIMGIIYEFKNIFNDLFVIFTGGNSKHFLDSGFEHDVHDEYLVLKGIKIISDLNENIN